MLLDKSLIRFNLIPFRLLQGVDDEGENGVLTVIVRLVSAERDQIYCNVTAGTMWQIIFMLFLTSSGNDDSIMSHNPLNFLFIYIIVCTLLHYCMYIIVCTLLYY